MNTEIHANSGNGGISNSEEDKLTKYLRNQTPIILQEEFNGLNHTANNDSIFENFSEDIIIPPLNTDIRFSEHLPLHTPTPDEAEGHSHSHPHSIVSESFNKYIIPSLDNTDIPLLSSKYEYNPHEHDHNSYHPRELHTHEHVHENFSWAIPTAHDSPLDLVKKSLIHKVSTQHACGSCWAVAFADTMSDCFVVSGSVGWSPNISATYIMSCIPSGKLHNMCFGGNPAAIAPYLEREGVSDTSCIDYSWCSGDSKLCKSVSSASHFDAKTLATRLNNNIPKPCGCYYKDIKKYLYTLDRGSDVFFINNNAPIDVFRNTVKSHILDFGPVIGGYVVLKNFFTGNFTDPNFNGGVYFDRADYNAYRGGRLQFSNRMTSEVAGLHAISIMGWGVAKNIQYDNDKFGDVPYWHCRNSWGEKWGNAGGYFKIAMYPFNKIAQFDKQVMTEIGGPVGSMILIRATQSPKVADLKQIAQRYRQNIQRQRSDTYYIADPQNVRKINRRDILDIDIDNNDQFDPGAIQDLFKKDNNFIIILIIIIAVGVWWMYRRMYRRV